MNFFVAAQSVLGGDDDAGTPDYAAGGAASLGVNGDHAGCGALGGLREGVGKFDEFG